LKILLVSSRYLPHRGGLETVVHHLAQNLLHQGHTVRIVTNRYPRTLSAYEMLDGISVTRLHFLLPGLDFIHSLRLDLWMASLFYRRWTEYSLRHIIREFQPDVINNHYLNEPAEFVGHCLQSDKSSVPWVVSLHGGDVDGEPLLDKRRMQRFCKIVRQANVLTACSHHLAKQAVGLEPSLGSKIQVIHNGVDGDFLLKVQPFVYGSPYILALGQLVRHKGFDLVIEAFSRVACKHPRVNLVIAGEGEFRPHLETLIESKELKHRISLLGRVDSSEVSSLMAGSLFVTMPSRREPFGIVALEAMAAGKCVLAAPVGGIPEFLPCPPNQMVPLEVVEWERALDNWLYKAELGQLDGTENRKAAQNYEWSTVSRHYLDVYGRALAS
jgi:glycosyltransferase involved in cell wall biosynthesis